MREKKPSLRQHLQGSLGVRTYFKGNSEEGRLPIYADKLIEKKKPQFTQD